MTDIRIVEVVNLQVMTMDWLLQGDGTLDETQELATAVCVALGSDALADETEVLPDPDSTDRRGWWADYQAAEIWGGWPIGCKNWLLKRAKIISDQASLEGTTVQRARDYTEAALQPFVDQRICTAVQVTAWRAAQDRIYVDVLMFRGPKTDIALRFQILWSE
jgi:phage gp46-like protein